MVAEEEAELAQRVTDGELTQAEADAKKADLQTRIADAVSNGFPQRGDGPPPGAPEAAPDGFARTARRRRRPTAARRRPRRRTTADRLGRAGDPPATRRPSSGAAPAGPRWWPFLRRGDGIDRGRRDGRDGLDGTVVGRDSRAAAVGRPSAAWRRRERLGDGLDGLRDGLERLGDGRCSLRHGLDGVRHRPGDRRHGLRDRGRHGLHDRCHGRGGRLRAGRHGFDDRGDDLCRGLDDRRDGLGHDADHRRDDPEAGDGIRRVVASGAGNGAVDRCERVAEPGVGAGGRRPAELHGRRARPTRDDAGRATACATSAASAPCARR